MQKQSIREFNKRVISLVENAGLLVIGIATVFAMGNEVLTMIRGMQVLLTDLLLLFLYLEVLAMVGLYTILANCRSDSRFTSPWWLWRVT